MPLDLNIRQMEVIRAVLQAGSMRGAAAELGVSQPAISRMVSYAEQRSGLRLFVREGTRLIPTPEALELKQEFERVFLNVDRAQRLAHALKQGWGRIVRLAAMPALSTTLVSGAVRRLVADHPKIKLILRVHELKVIEERVGSGDFDLGLVNAVKHPQDMTTVPLGEAPVVCLLHPSHPLAGRPVLSPGDLAGLPLISLSSLSPLGARLDEAFEAHGVQRQVAIQTSHALLAAQLVAAEVGVGLVDPFCLPSIAPLGLVVRRFEPAVTVRPLLLHRRDRVLSAVEQALLDHLRQEGADWARDVGQRTAR